MENEFVIRDYEGFEGIRLRETDNLAKVVALAEALEEYGEAFAIFWENRNSNWVSVQDALEEFDDSYLGWYESIGEYAHDYVMDLYDIPVFLTGYIDWEAVGRDFELNGDIWTHAGKRGVHVFRNI